MEDFGPVNIVAFLMLGGGISFAAIRYLKNGFIYFIAGLTVLVLPIGWMKGWGVLLEQSMALWLPLFFVHTVIYGLVDYYKDSKKVSKVFEVKLRVKGKSLVLGNIRRGVSVMASAGSGKTESVIYGFLEHFRKEQFSGIIHDYKDFEITEMARPLWKDQKVPLKIVSFGPIYHRVNPIAPRYLPDEESVHEVSRVLLENLMEHRDSDENSTSRFFKDAAEGLISGLIWRLRTDYPDFCTLPHVMALYQQLGTKSLIKFLRENLTSRAMADAFISGVGSERQTAGVMSTLANAIKKISTRKIFMVLSADEIPLDINNEKHPSVIALVNNPQKDASLSPVIATITHTISKQMSQRNRRPSFMLLEEASTLRLLNMHRIPATLRSYDIVSVYVLQDKVQNDLMYGEKASKAILSNLSYQFFGKVNDPDTARYYERFFELVKMPTRSVSKSSGLNLERRITEGEKEVSKRRAEVFFRLKQGEFVVFDGILVAIENQYRDTAPALLPLQLQDADLERDVGALEAAKKAMAILYEALVTPLYGLKMLAFIIGVVLWLLDIFIYPLFLAERYFLLGILQAFFPLVISLSVFEKFRSLAYTYFKLYAGVYMLVPAFFLVNVFVNNLYTEINTNFWGNLFGTDWGYEFFAPIIELGTIGFVVLLKFKLYRKATSFTLRLFTG